MSNEQHQQETTERPEGPALYLIEATPSGDKIDHGWISLTDYDDLAALLHAIHDTKTHWREIVDQEGFGSLDFAKFCVAWSIDVEDSWVTEGNLSDLDDLNTDHGGDGVEKAHSLFGWSSGFDHLDDWRDVSAEISDRLDGVKDHKDQPLGEYAQQKWNDYGCDIMPGLTNDDGTPIPDRIINMLDWNQYARDYLDDLYEDGVYLWRTD